MHAPSTSTSVPNASPSILRGAAPAARPGQRGVALIYTVLLGMLMIGFLGIAIDSAYILSTKQQLQHAADAAALAGVQKVKSELDPLYPLTRKSATDIAASNNAATLTVKLDANTINLPAGDIVVGVWDPFTKAFTPSLVTPNAVQVRAKRDTAHADGPLGLLFGPFFGTSSSDVGVVATAVMAPASDPLILILDPTRPNALRINGTNTVNAMAGRVHANSSNPCGISLVGTEPSTRAPRWFRIRWRTSCRPPRTGTSSRPPCRCRSGRRGGSTPPGRTVRGSTPAASRPRAASRSRCSPATTCSESRGPRAASTCRAAPS
jgi:Flp pilus assembly protein TadG